MPKRPPDRPSERTASEPVRRDLSEQARLEAQLLGTEAGAGVDPQRRRPPAPVEGLILVVDDDADMRAYVGRCLHALGHTRAGVAEAADGKEAMTRIRRGGVGLVICDILMPGMDGLALCRALRADARFRHLPVLLITGEYRRDDLPPVCLANTGVLLKPFNAHRLHAALDDLLPRAPPA